MCEPEEENGTGLDAGRQTDKMNYTVAVNGDRQKRCALAVAEGIDRTVIFNIKMTILMKIRCSYSAKKKAEKQTHRTIASFGSRNSNSLV